MTVPASRQPQTRVQRLGHRPQRQHWLALALLVVGNLLALTGWAAEVVLELSARQMTVDDVLSIQIKASGDFDEVTTPLADGFTLQETGRNTRVNIVNGSVSRTLVMVWAATPSRPGNFPIGPVSLKQDGQVVAKSATANVQVLSAAEAAPAQNVESAMNLSQYLGQKVFVRPVVTVTRPYVGQTFDVSFELLWSARERILSLRNVAEPAVEGQDGEDLKIEQPTPRAVEFAGRPYKSQLTHRLAVTPIRPGKLRIQAPAFRAELGDFFEARALRVAGVTLEIDVQPLPEHGRPANFDPGAIGQLKLSGEAQAAGRAGQRLEVQVGERILLEYEVSGRGNLGGLRPVGPPPLTNMLVEALPGRVDDGLTRGADGVQQGSRSFQYMLSFMQPGVYVLPELVWTTFDPETKQYRASNMPPVEVVVTGEGAASTPVGDPAAGSPSGAGTGAGSGTGSGSVAGAGAGTSAAAAPAASGPGGEWSQVLASLRPLADRAGLSSAGADQSRTPDWVWWAAAASWIGGLGLLGAARWRRGNASRQRIRHRDAALHRAREALTAATALGPDEGYSAIRTAVFAWLADAGGATFVTSEGQTRAALQARQIPAEAISALCNLLSHCEYARFAPGGSRDNELRDTAAQVLQALERIDPLLRERVAGTAAAGAVLALLLVAATFSAPGAATAATLDDAFGAARTAQLAGRHAEAARQYKDILSHGVTSAAVHYNLAAALLASGKAGEAVAHYQHALRLDPEPALASDARHNLDQVRGALAERARRKHSILHIFDEAPSVDEWLAEAAPRSLLAGLSCLFGLLFVGALALALRQPRQRWRWTAGGALVLQWLCIGWLHVAERVDASVHRGVVVQEDVPLEACSGGGEPMELPEGLGLRILDTTADGRLQVRLGNGRQGCLPATAVYRW